jgi:uncharacterized protein (TIGR03067 family)
MTKKSPASKRSADLARLQGTWIVTSLEVDGGKMGDLPAGEARIVVKKNRFVSLGMGGTYEGTVEIDESKKPKTFDLVFTAGHAKGTRNPGIYELHGDRWRICLSTSGPVRPKTFATKAGSGFALELLERDLGKTVRKGKAEQQVAMAPPQIESGSGPATELEGEWAMSAAVFGGAPMDASMVAWCKRITRGNLTTIVAGPQTMLKANFTIDRSVKPSAIDYINLHGPSKGKAQPGIFELNGSELKICMAAPGDPRPKEFASKKGDGRSFTTWTRRP